MIKSMPRDVWVTAGVVVAMCGLYAGLVWWPAQRQLNLYETRSQGATERLAVINASESQLANLEQEVQEFRERLATDEHFVPDQPQLSSFLRSLTESVRDQGVLDQELRTREFKRYRDYSLVPTSMEFVSGFREAVNVIEAIENHRRLTAVNRTALSRDNDTRGRGGLAASVELAAYFTGDQEVRP